MELVKETRINGTFTGCKAGNLYETADGKVWRQVRYKYRYKYAYRPRAKIWKDGSRYFLEVDRMNEMIEIKKASKSDLERDAHQSPIFHP